MYNKTKFTSDEHKSYMITIWILIILFAVFFLLDPIHWYLYFILIMAFICISEFWIVGKNESSYKKRSRFQKR